MHIQSSIDNIESGLSSWHHRDILSCINWLYRVNVLCNHGMRGMQLIWEVISLFEGYATQSIIWAYTIKSVISSTQDDRLSEG